MLICQPAPSRVDNLIHHSDRGGRYLSTKYTERLIEAGIDPSVDSVGDSDDNALAESTIGLFKTDHRAVEIPSHTCFACVARQRRHVEWGTLKWVNWYNTKRLHSKIGYITPQEAEENFYQALNAVEKAA